MPQTIPPAPMVPSMDITNGISNAVAISESINLVIDSPGIIHSDEWMIPAAIQWNPEEYQQLGQLNCVPNEVGLARFVMIVATKDANDFELRKAYARRLAMQADSALNFSARTNGNGIRHFRFECDNDNRPKVIWEQDYDAAIDLKNALVRKYATPDRKIIVFAPDFGGCGYAWLVPNSTKINNPNETYPSGAFISYYCMGVDVFVHEVIHQLGAVMAEAPHYSSGHHCNDMYDVMCYYTGNWPCDNLVYALILFDCNGDDYFRVNNIPTDNYLYHYWNVADSRFLNRTEDMYFPMVYSYENAVCEMCAID